ncbi:MAG: hypothetical protein AAB923_01745 [Patescibacteria group bacterium]
MLTTSSQRGLARSATAKGLARSATAKGFMALISVIVISFVFLIAVVSLGQFGLAGRLLLLDVENKAASEGHAEACVAVARILIVNDPLSALSNREVTQGDVTCTIVSLAPGTPSSGYSTIKSQAMVASSTTNFVVVIDTTTHNVVSWREHAVMP